MEIMNTSGRMVKTTMPRVGRNIRPTCAFWSNRERRSWPMVFGRSPFLMATCALYALRRDREASRMSRSSTNTLMTPYSRMMTELSPAW